MSSAAPDTPPPAASAGSPLNAQIEQLRAGVSALTAESGLMQLVTNLAESVERLRLEHAGMAEELLGVYEQLGVVFEVTRRLPSVHSESDVVDLFVDCFRRSFGEFGVFVVPAERDDAAASEHTQGASDWFRDLVHRARSSGIIVEQPPPDAMPEPILEVMAAPILAGGSFVGAIVLTRGSDSTAFHTADMLVVESLTTFCGDLIRNLRLTRELGEMSIAMVRALVNAVDQKDEYTCGHSIRVGYFATLLGRAVGLPQDELQMLQWSALLHDVGKIGIRDDVLKKPGKLTAEEFAHIQEHPVRSHKVVQEVPQLARALPGVLYHHERFDGTGYPARLAGTEIPLQARIIQTADIFDALTSTRSYRPAYDWREALDILARDAGKSVDPELQTRFDGLIREAIGEEPRGWERLVHRANNFSYDTYSPEGGILR